MQLFETPTLDEEGCKKLARGIARGLARDLAEHFEGELYMFLSGRGIDRLEAVDDWDEIRKVCDRTMESWGAQWAAYASRHSK